jgi:predicted DNA-binding protein (UPF0251 family)/predicted Fe-Mo cluster-binding NifX family protein
MSKKWEGSIVPRLPKCRKIRVFPDYYSFVPENSEKPELETITLTLDEYETLKLLDAEGMNQEDCANSMGVARTTVTAMYESARRKIAIALVEGKRIRISGGNVEMDRNQAFFNNNLKSKGVNTMRVAVTYDNGNVFGHFGRTEQFKVYDIEDGKVVNSEVVSTNGEGCGALAGVLNLAEVDVLICGGIGGGAVMALQEAGIQLYAGASGNTDEVVNAFLAGTLAASGEANCSHQDEEHGDGHSCHGHGHGSCHN